MRKETAGMTHKKLSWDEYFIQIAELVAQRTNCLSRGVGAVLVKDKMIISTGYNGTPRGVTNCDEGGCTRCTDRAKGRIKSGEKLDECFCIHAEENAILQAAYHGIATKGTTLYVTNCPCLVCARHIINAGIVKVYYNKAYAMDGLARKLLEEAGVELVEYNGGA